VTYDASATLLVTQTLTTIGTPPVPALVDFILDTDTGGADNFALLDFGTDQLGFPLRPGHYANAQRAVAAAPGFPGLDVSFQHNGCLTLTGEFTIDEVSFSTNSFGMPAVEHFAASFEQHCEGETPALRGTFYFDANGIPPIVASTPHSIPTTTPLSTAACAVMLAVAGALGLRHRARPLQ